MIGLGIQREKMVEWTGLENRRMDEFELYTNGDYIRNY